MGAGPVEAGLIETAGHGLHVALLAAGLVAVAVLLWPGRRSRGRRGRDERARLRALRESARAGTLGAPDRDRGT